MPLTLLPSIFERVRNTLQEVLFVMGANLSQIEERWDSGRLRATGLSSQHVISLVSSARPHPFTLSTSSASLLRSGASTRPSMQF